jgi:siroheme synthase
MGLARLEQIVLQLGKAGMPAATPACAIQDGTLRTQRQVVSTLGRLYQEVRETMLESPVLIVVGEVVRLAQVPAVDQNAKAA